MARPLRIEFSGAIYHVMARGNGRQLLFHEDRDYQRLTEGLEKTVERTAWEILAFVWPETRGRTTLAGDSEEKWAQPHIIPNFT